MGKIIHLHEFKERMKFKESLRFDSTEPTTIPVATFCKGKFSLAIEGNNLIVYNTDSKVVIGIKVKTGIAEEWIAWGTLIVDSFINYNKGN